MKFQINKTINGQVVHRGMRPGAGAIFRETAPQCIMAIMYFEDEYYDVEYSGYGHTRDPAMDRMVKKFLHYFQDTIKEGNVSEVNNLYGNSFPKLTEQFFKTFHWPGEEDIAEYVADDPICTTGTSMPRCRVVPLLSRDSSPTTTFASPSTTSCLLTPLLTYSCPISG